MQQRKKNLSHGLVAFVLAACGESATIIPDAAPLPDAAAPCVGVGAEVHVEDFDVANDGELEATGKTLAAASPIEICGQIGRSIVADRYSFTLAEEARVRVHITMPGADAAEDVFAHILEVNPPNDDGRRGTSSVQGDRITFVSPNCTGNDPDCGAQTLPPGEYVLQVAPFSFSQRPPTRPFEYRARITTYDADARCPMPVTVAYTESRDADPTNDQNDVVKTGFDGGKPTDNPNDAPEPSASALVILPGEGKRVAGVAGTRVDSTKDLDAYNIITGPGTTAIDVRIAWTGANDDLDIDIYEGGPGLENLIARGWAVANPEIMATAVKPNQQYMLVVHRYGETAALPYDMTICGTAEP